MWNFPPRDEIDWVEVTTNIQAIHVASRRSHATFQKLMEILIQVQSMRDRLISVVTRFDQINYKTPSQQELFHENVKDLQEKLMHEENAIVEKLHSHAFRHFQHDYEQTGHDFMMQSIFPAHFTIDNEKNFGNFAFVAGRKEKDYDENSVDIVVRSCKHAPLTKAQKNACNRIRKIRYALGNPAMENSLQSSMSTGRYEIIE
ncbi:hypothetical protein HHI36_005450 [Cryptolaemus montrouzieri]|uniref:Uncharacterized protein n=1 Tax=Cryptolaemus montrouzieri TaxID=559131 RepID=A0ABD2NUH0_9CUCU